jgi:hypothetical protein
LIYDKQKGKQKKKNNINEIVGNEKQQRKTKTMKQKTIIQQ